MIALPDDENGTRNFKAVYDETITGSTLGDFNDILSSPGQKRAIVRDGSDFDGMFKDDPETGVMTTITASLVGLTVCTVVAVMFVSHFSKKKKRFAK